MFSFNLLASLRLVIYDALIDAVKSVVGFLGFQEFKPLRKTKSTELLVDGRVEIIVTD